MIADGSQTTTTSNTGRTSRLKQVMPSGSVPGAAVSNCTCSITFLKPPKGTVLEPVVKARKRRISAGVSVEIASMNMAFLGACKARLEMVASAINSSAVHDEVPASKTSSSSEWKRHNTRGGSISQKPLRKLCSCVSRLATKRLCTE